MKRGHNLHSPVSLLNIRVNDLIPEREMDFSHNESLFAHFMCNNRLNWSGSVA